MRPSSCGLLKHSNTQTRLRNTQGDIVGTKSRSDTLADHLEHFQWRVRPISLQPDRPPAIYPALLVEEGLFNHRELRRAIEKLASGKAVRDRDVPIECYKALINSPGPCMQHFLELCNECWAHGQVPRDWLTARVAMIFKKGDPAISGNYRPICLTMVAYRTASMRV
jgi:hypothetical protein